MLRCLILGSIAILFAMLFACSSSSAPSDESLPIEVKLAEGVVRGERSAESDVRVFKNIPYAAPPVGANRWKRPQPVAPWTEPRIATAFGKRCMQPTTNGDVNTNETDEDCLSLNVWTPSKKPAGGPMPIMVWIHGGAFTFGSGRDDLYEAAKLAKATQSIIVTVNYRLGVLGFLGHPTLAAEDPNNATGNFGLMDQKAALEWVARNAVALGGDPKSVTIFGESAGGISTLLLAAWPDAQKLFHRVISQSGPANGFRLPELSDAETEANDLGKALACTGDIITCLRTKTAGELLTALKHGDAQPYGGLLQGSTKVKVWLPVVDGYVVIGQGADIASKKAFARLPYILGTNKDECTVLYNGLFGDKKLTAPEQYVPALELAYGKANATTVAEKYPVTSFPDPTAALARTCTLSLFVCPTRRLARSLAPTSPTFMYQLRRPPNGGLIAGLGAAHAADLVFLFDSDTGTGGRAGDDARDLVAAMQGYWGSFAKKGEPASTNAPAWPAFGADERALVFDVPLSVDGAPGKEDCDFWDGLGSFPPPKFYAPPK